MQCCPRLPSCVPQRLQEALSPSVLADDSQIFTYISKDLLWGKDLGSESHLTALQSDIPNIYFLPLNCCQILSTFQEAP